MGISETDSTNEGQTTSNEFNYNILQRFAIGFVIIVSNFLIIGLPMMLKYQAPPTYWPITVYGLCVTSLLLIVSIQLKKKSSKHAPLLFTFFIGSCANTVFEIINHYIIEQVLPESKFRPAWWTVISTVIIAGIIISLAAVAKKKRFYDTGQTVKESIYLQKGDLKLGLSVGIGIFVIFFVLQVMMTNTELFNSKGQTVNWNNVHSWLFPSLTWSFFNGFREELWSRGLVLQKTEPYLGKFGANFCQAVPFALAHLQVGYTTNHLLFMVLLLILALIFGWLMQKTRSVIGPAIAHAGVDLPITLSTFVSFGL
jgi:membrane protease YdiL (CAAX protease family)